MTERWDPDLTQPVEVATRRVAEATPRVAVAPGPVKAGGPSSRAASLGAVAVVGLVVAVVLLVRPFGGAPSGSQESDNPSATSGQGAVVTRPPAGSATAEPVPSVAPAASEVEPATAGATSPPTERPDRTPRPSKPPKPTTAPTTFAAHITVQEQCSNELGLEVVGIETSWSGPTDVRRVVILVDGAHITDVPFDAGATEGIAGTGTPVTPNEPHEATAEFYGAGEELIASGVSSGSFQVELTESCGS